MDKQVMKRIPIKAWQTDWKEELRRQCLLRVNRERSQLLWRIRSTSKPSEAPKEAAALAFSEILEDEISKFKMAAEVQNSFSQAEDKPDMLWDYQESQAVSGLNQDDYEELMIAMQKILSEDVQDEEKRKEAYLLEDYENVSLLEDESLAALFEHLQTSEEDGLLCPICRTRYLKQNQCHIYCGCGEFKLNTQNDQVDLQFLRSRLSEVVVQHLDLGCTNQPTFNIECKFGITALYIQCFHCGMFDLVL